MVLFVIPVVVLLAIVGFALHFRNAIGAKATLTSAADLAASPGLHTRRSGKGLGQQRHARDGDRRTPPSRGPERFHGQRRQQGRPSE